MLERTYACEKDFFASVLLVTKLGYVVNGLSPSSQSTYIIPTLSIVDLYKFCHINNNFRTDRYRLRKGLMKRTCELRICDAMDLLLWVMYLLFHNRVTKYHVILPTIWHSLFVILSWWLVVFQSRSICLLHINVWRLNKWNIEMSEYTMMSVIHNDETIALIIVWCHYN